MSELMRMPTNPLGNIPRPKKRQRDIERRQLDVEDALARSDEAALMRARDLSNEATLVDMENELAHQLKLSQIQRRGRRAMDVMQGANTLITAAGMLADGNAAKNSEFIDIYAAWKQGEIYRMMTE